MTRDKETAKERTFKTFIRMSMVRKKKKKETKGLFKYVGSLMPVVQKESSLFIGKYEKTDVY